MDCVPGGPCIVLDGGGGKGDETTRMEDPGWDVVTGEPVISCLIITPGGSTLAP